MKHIEIKLLPTEFILDVWISKDVKALAKRFNKRYGASIEYYENDIVVNSVNTLNGTMESELKGHTVFVMILGSNDKGIMVHEIIHVLWHMSKRIHLEIKYNSQEWQACMAEYIFNQITKN